MGSIEKFKGEIADLIKDSPHCGSSETWPDAQARGVINVVCDDCGWRYHHFRGEQVPGNGRGDDT